MGVVIRRWVWLETIGVVSGCFPHITIYPYCSCICSFLQQHPYFFFHFVKMILYIYIYEESFVISYSSNLTFCTH